jgi:hypothetical protein
MKTTETTPETLQSFLNVKGTGHEPHIYFKSLEGSNSWSNFTHSPQSWSDPVGYYISPLLSFGDYDNSCHIERSNLRVFKEMHADRENIDFIEIWGAYGSAAIAIKLDCTNTDILEALAALESYPCLDDQDATNLESEMINEALISYLPDIQKKIDKQFNFDYSNPEEENFIAFIYSIMEENNIYGEIESGGVAYIDINKICDNLPAQMPSWYNGEIL